MTGREKIPFGGGETACWTCDLNVAGTPLKVWVDDQGRVLKESEAGGRLVLERVAD